MKPRPEHERRKRRRGHPLRAAVVGVWAVGAFLALLAAYGPFWRDVSYWMERAMAHADRQEWVEALRYVGHALDGAPEDPDILTFAGHLHRELEAWPEAAQRFEQALAVDSGRPEASLGLAEADLTLGDTVGTATALREMRLEDADEDQRARAVALAEAAGLPGLALDLLEPAADADPETRRARARLTRAAGRTTDALDAYAALHSDGLLDVEGALTYAWMLNERGEHDRALDVLEGAPPSEETHALAARTALWADRLDRAETHVASLSPGSGAAQELMVLLADAQTRRQRIAAAALARAEVEAEAARLRDTPPADPTGALDFWRDRLTADPSDVVARAESVALLEASGRFDEALVALLGEASIQDVAAGGGPRAVHAARLALWAGRPEDAVRILAPSGDAPELLAQARFEAGDVDGAYRTLAEARRRAAVNGAPGPTDAATLLLTARVADAAGRPTEAADALSELARVRTLDVDERRWWAGLLWRSGGLEGALAGYESLRELTPDDPSVHRAVGDLRLALDDPAGAAEAYRQAIRLGGPGDAAGPGLGLALLRQDRDAAALEAYGAYLDAVPEDTEARLAFARALAGSGDFARAATEYELALRPISTAEPELAEEVASAWMAAGAHAQAEAWARRAADAPDRPLARARLAQLLTLLGRHVEAQAAVDGLTAERAEGSPDLSPLEGALVDAWIHRLRNRPLAALASLDTRLEAGDTSRLAVDARVFRAEVLESRGDLDRARRGVADAQDAGAGATDVDHLRQAIERRSRPVAAAGVETGSDARALDVTTVWGRAALRPASLGAPGFSLELRHRSASQGSATGDGTAFLLGADSLFLSAALRLDGRLGVESVGGGSARLLGSLSAVWESLSAVRWTLELSRMPVWSEAQRRGAPEYARVADLGVLDAGLMVHEARAAVTTTARSPVHKSAHGELGVARYSDGNHRVFGYAQWRIPLHADGRSAFALGPNVYAEGYDETQPGYASPTGFLALGLAAEAYRSIGRFALDGRLNPHGYRYPGERGLGLEGRAGVGMDAGLGSVRIEGRYLKQGGVYDLFRLGTEVSLPLGGAPR